MKARALVLSALGLVVMAGLSVPALMPVSAKTATTINVYDDGDTNIDQLFTNLGARYHKLHPDVNVNVIFNQHGVDDNAIYARLAASQKAGRPAPFDLTDAGFIAQGELVDMWTRIGTAAIPNARLVAPNLIQENLHQAVPYRGSEVVLAYNSTTVKNPPHTLAQLLAWIRANPGKFDYCNPADGGSGDAFVQAVATMGLKPAVLNRLESPGHYTPATESAWSTNLKTLAGLGKDMYRGGFYPGGNTQVLQLLAQGAIQMATVWSDQSTAALKAGQLPKTVKLLQRKDPFSGGAVNLAIPRNSAHVAAAEAFVNWMLEPAQQVYIMNSISGFPGIEWKYLPAAARAQFAAVAGPYVNGLASQYSADLTAAWQNTVAGASANG